MTLVKNQVAKILFNREETRTPKQGQINAAIPKRSRQEQSTTALHYSDEEVEELQDQDERPWNPAKSTVKTEPGTTFSSNTYMTQEDYNDLHSGEKYESYKLTIAMFTANETVAKDALARVARGRFHSDAFIAAINRENQNFQWKEKHKVAIANLSELNKHTQTLIKECGLEERPQIQGKGGTKRERPQGRGTSKREIPYYNRN